MQGAQALQWPPASPAWGSQHEPGGAAQPCMTPISTASAAPQPPAATGHGSLSDLDWQIARGHAQLRLQPSQASAAWQQQMPSLPSPQHTPRLLNQAHGFGGDLRQQSQMLERAHQQQQLWQHCKQPPQQTPLLLPGSPARSSGGGLSPGDQALMADDCLPDLHSLLGPGAEGEERASSHSPTDTALFGRAGSLGRSVSDAAWTTVDDHTRPKPRVCMHPTRSGQSCSGFFACVWRCPSRMTALRSLGRLTTAKSDGNCTPVSTFC